MSGGKSTKRETTKFELANASVYLMELTKSTISIPIYSSVFLPIVHQRAVVGALRWNWMGWAQEEVGKDLVVAAAAAVDFGHASTS